MAGQGSVPGRHEGCTPEREARMGSPEAPPMVVVVESTVVGGGGGRDLQTFILFFILYFHFSGRYLVCPIGC